MPHRWHTSGGRCVRCVSWQAHSQTFAIPNNARNSSGAQPYLFALHTSGSLSTQLHILFSERLAARVPGSGRNASLIMDSTSFTTSLIYAHRTRCLVHALLCLFIIFPVVLVVIVRRGKHCIIVCFYGCRLLRCPIGFRIIFPDGLDSSR